MTRVDITVNRARESLKKLTYFNKVTLKWVKAHRKSMPTNSGSPSDGETRLHSWTTTH